jgi:hypothetical protein
MAAGAPLAEASAPAAAYFKLPYVETEAAYVVQYGVLSSDEMTAQMISEPLQEQLSWQRSWQ